MDGTASIDDGELWLFAYGSLLWAPGFRPAESPRARLDGWRRRFCMWSHHWRGTPADPGLVLALDAEAGASCEGLALRVAPDEAARVLAAVRGRELVSDAYEERRLPLALEGGRVVEAVAYVIRRDHHQYAGRLEPDRQAAVIARAQGEKGSNLVYLGNTARHLHEAGIRDSEIEDVWARARRLVAET